MDRPGTDGWSACSVQDFTEFVKRSSFCLAPRQTDTEVPTVAPTEPPTEAPTEPSTEPPTQAPCSDVWGANKCANKKSQGKCSRRAVRNKCKLTCGNCWKRSWSQITPWSYFFLCKMIKNPRLSQFQSEMVQFSIYSVFPKISWSLFLLMFEFKSRYLQK